MLKADLHIHSGYSMDCSLALEDIIRRCQELGINCIALADHGTTDGALRMQGLAPFPVIVAEEILTPHGEIMGMFLKETIPSHITVEEAIARIRAQDGLVCVPHPCDNLRPSALGSKMLEQIIEHVDVIEVFNARAMLPAQNRRAKQHAVRHGIPGTAGSDAHTLGEIGNAYVEMPEFKTKEEFLESLAGGRVVGRRTSPFVHFASLNKKLRSRFR